MKKCNYIVIGLLGLGLLCSCELTLEPEDTISPKNYFNKAADLELWCNGYYTQLAGANDLAGTNADDMIDNSLGDLMMGQRSAADESGWTWTMLRKINYYFENSGNCQDDDAKKQYDGVSHFMRAYFYWIKVRRYGDVPWYDEVILSDDYSQLRKAREDRGIIMDNIMADLDKAIDLLPTKKDNVHVTKWTALALKCRVALYEGTFRKYHSLGNADKYLRLAAEAAELFINDSGYKLYTTGTQPYRDLFNSLDAVSDEIILTRKYSATANVLHSVQFNIKNDRAGFTKRLVNHYLMKDGSFYSSQANYDEKIFTEEVANRDPRLEQTILCPGYIQTGASKVTANNLNALTGYQPIKYVNGTAYDGSNKSYPLS